MTRSKSQKKYLKSESKKSILGLDDQGLNVMGQFMCFCSTSREGVQEINTKHTITPTTAGQNSKSP